MRKFALMTAGAVLALGGCKNKDDIIKQFTTQIDGCAHFVTEPESDLGRAISLTESAISECKKALSVYEEAVVEYPNDKELKRKMDEYFFTEYGDMFDHNNESKGVFTKAMKSAIAGYEDHYRWLKSPEGKASFEEQERINREELEKQERYNSERVSWQSRRKWIENWEEYKTMLYVQSHSDNVVVKSISINRGNCQVLYTIPTLPARLNYGQQIEVMPYSMPECRVLSVEVTTENGEHIINAD